MGNTESHKRTEYHNHVTIHETPISPAYEGYTIRISSPSNKRSKKQELPSNCMKNAQTTSATPTNNAVNNIQTSVTPVHNANANAQITYVTPTNNAKKHLQKTCTTPLYNELLDIQTFVTPYIECQNIQTTRVISTNNSTTVKKPECFTTKMELMSTWFSWKKEFHEYIQSIDRCGINGKNWGLMLLNSMGPIGQEVHNSFTFNNPRDKEDINILIEKFDEYCLLKKRQRKPGEDIKEYVHALQLSCTKSDGSTEEFVIKQNILTEIHKDLFTETARTLLPTFTFSPSNFYCLTLKEIMFIWQVYEEKCLNEEKEKRNDMIVNCDNCGYDHGFKSCRAQGKQCAKCNEFNHFSRRCPKIYYKECIYCGGSHFRGKCLAYDNLCSKCKRRNHFPWKCNARMNFKTNVRKY